MHTSVSLLMLCACGSATPTPAYPKGGPRGLRASEHLDVASQHEQLARSRSSWPDASSDRAPYNMPWVRSWDAASDEERIAAVHRSRADELHAAYAEACGDRPIEQVSVSPLERYGIGGWNTTSGVILYLTADAGMPDKLIADMRCHRAWMMLAPAGMEDCPLDLPGIQVDARGDKEGITVSITVQDAKLVEELHRRAAHDLESSGKQR